ncbi:MAG: WecB/TagA/CpsF family glycosyltransferase [Patescibacteria group bacterium]|nr:WecB/TagA/CpsF family glycosyltransferase [Patescibacteria group bacterium]
METISILGIKITNLDREKLLLKAKEFLAGSGQHFIVTPNPEIIMAADRDEELFYILNSADLSLGDGIGLKIASWLNGKNLPRITGADFSADLLDLAAAEKTKVGVLIWKGGLSKKNEVEDALRLKYPTLDFMVESIGRETDTIVGDKFLNYGPVIVLVGLGFPWQEKFIFHNIKKIPSAKIMMGVGGTFDFMTGRRKRALKIIRFIGMEWLWRFFFNPQVVGQKRSERIRNAIFIFPWEFIKRKIFYPFFYRHNVACLLYKKEGDKYKILIVERQNEPGHWQLPQGGTDRERLLVAGARELSEEINSDKFIAKRVFKDVYRYKFGNRPGETSMQAKTRRKHTGFKGQSQGLFIAEFTGRDEDIKINFWDHSAWKWVDSDKLVDSVHLIRKRSAQRFLKKFKEFVKQK